MLITTFTIYACYFIIYGYTTASYTKASKKAQKNIRKWGILVLLIHLCGGVYHILRDPAGFYTALGVLFATSFASGTFILIFRWYKESRASEPEGDSTV